MKISLSIISILIVFLAALTIDLSLKNWEKQDRAIENDVYGYLPMLFIYDDVKLKKSDYKMGDNYYYFSGPHYTEGGGFKLVKATVGLSVLYSPFFFMAHGVALLSDYPPDGFSEPYKAFLLLAALFYLFIGLVFVRKILRRFNFSDKHIAITILVLGLGTNLMAYSSQSGTMPHVYNFTLFSLFVFYTIKWYEKQSYKNTLIIGFLLGLISLIRPTNVLIALFFLLYDITSFNDLKNRLILYKKHFFKLLFIGPAVLLIWAPQFLYWKIITGKFIYYSYTEEGFYFADPKIIEGLFSFRKGWLVYTPIMVFSIIGFFFLKGNLKKVKAPIILFTILNIYIIFSWWCWWYGGTYGQRSMIDSYAMLSIPLAAFIRFIDQKKVVRYFYYAVMLFFGWLNIFQTYQYEYKYLHYDSMSMKLYFKQFGIMHRKTDFAEYLDWADYDAAKYRGQKKKEEGTVDQSIERKEINLKAYNDNFLCTEWDRVIVADKPIANTWEKFTLIMYEGDECSLVSYDDKFLTINESNGLLWASSELEVAETRFKIEYRGDDIITLKSKNGKYLSVNPETLKIEANKDTVGDNEKFKMINL